MAFAQMRLKSREEGVLRTESIGKNGKLRELRSVARKFALRVR